MVKRHRIRQFMTNLFLVSLFSAALVYFAYQSVSGDFGTLASARYAEDVRLLEVEKARLEADMKDWQQLTSMLGSSGQVDRDLLGERARNVLGYVEANEIVILLPESKR